MNRYLYNPWTDINHGHARSELIRAKKLLEENKYASEILSESIDFGDALIKSEPYRNIQIPRWLDRGPIFKLSKRRLENQRLETLVNFLKSKSNATFGQVIITSARIEVLTLVGMRELDHLEFRIRLIEPPRKTRDIIELRKTSKSSRVSLAIETSDGKHALEKLGIENVFMVPPIQGLIPEATITTGQQIGILWPVSFEESKENFDSFMNSIRDFNAIVRLPGNFEGEVTRMKYPSHTYIDRGISEDEFNRYISKIRVAILPHRNYDLRGSGLAAILAGSGATIFSFRGNSFFNDISQNASIVPLDDLIEGEDLLTTKLNQELLVKPQKNEYKIWTQKCWEDFLFHAK